MKKIKVLHIINDLGVGGAQRIVATIVTLLDRDWFEPLVVNLNYRPDYSIEQELIGTGIKVLRLPALMKGDPFTLWRLLRLFRSSRVDIVHTHLFLAGFYGTLAARWAGVPVVVSTEHNTSTMSTKPIWYRRLAATYLKNNSRIFAISNAVKRAILFHQPFLENKIRVVYNGIDLEKFRPVRRPGTNSEFVVGTLLRDDPRKGFAVFRKAARYAHQSGMPITFVAGLSHPVADCGDVEPVTLSGQDKVLGFLAKLNIFVLPSLEEGLGLSAIEAMAMGVPVIVSDAGGLPEVVDHQVTGLVFPAGDAAALWQAIRLLFGDRELADSLAAAGLEKVKTFSAKRMTTELETNYIELTEHA